jgi:CRISPR system Cascade subunit CasD
MDFLVFQLQAPLGSWGEAAVGEYRGTCDSPGESALLGLLAAALGVRREDDATLTGLRQGYGFAVGVQEGGTLLRDYHTAQVPGRTALKGRPHATRRDELVVPKTDLHTILSTRDYRQNPAYLVAVQARVDPPHPLETLANALRRPRFVLYMGRKSCPLAAPLYPRVIHTDSALTAFESYAAQIEQLRAVHQDTRGRKPLEEVASLIRITWSEGVAAGVTPDLSAPRKDRVIRRKGWQFGDRTEHVWLRNEGA